MKQNELDSLYIWQEWHVCLQATDIRTLAFDKRKKCALKKLGQPALGKHFIKVRRTHSTVELIGSLLSMY